MLRRRSSSALALQGLGVLPAPADPARAEVRPWDWLLICTAVNLVVAVDRFHVLFPGLKVIKPAVLISAIGLGLLFLNTHHARRVGLVKDRTSLAALAVIGWATITAPFGLYVGNSVRFLATDMYAVGALFLLLATAVRNVEDVRRLTLWLTVGGGGLALYYLLQEASGTGYDRNDVAMIISCTVPLTVYFMVRTRAPRWRLVLLASLTTIVAAVVETDSRGGFLALGVGLAYSLLFLRGVGTGWRIVVVGGAVLFLSTTANEAYWERMRTIMSLEEDYNTISLTGRKQIWKRGIGYMLADPLTGVGIDNFSVAEGLYPVIRARIEQGQGTKYSAAHSAWVQVGAELGIPGAVAFLTLVLGTIWQLNRVRARAPPTPGPDRDAGELAAALVGAMLSLGMAMSLLSQGYSNALWSMLGLAAGLFKVVRLRHAPTTALPQRRSWSRR